MLYAPASPACSASLAGAARERDDDHGPGPVERVRDDLLRELEGLERLGQVVSLPDLHGPVIVPEGGEPLAVAWLNEIEGVRQQWLNECTNLRERMSMFAQ